MTEYEVIGKLGEIDFAPSSEVLEVLQNVKTICSTMKYSVPMDRGLGVDGVYVDEPLTTVRGKLSGELIRAIKTYEPRAKVKSIEYKRGPEGELIPKLKITIEGSRA